MRKRAMHVSRLVIYRVIEGRLACAPTFPTTFPTWGKNNLGFNLLVAFEGRSFSSRLVHNRDKGHPYIDFGPV